MEENKDLNMPSATDNSTMDYNQLYGNNEATTPEQPTAAPNPVATAVVPAAPAGIPVAPDAVAASYGAPTQNPIKPSATGNDFSTESPIVFEEEKQVEIPQTVNDVIPAFDTSVLEDDLSDDLKPKKEEKLIHTLTSETQQEKEQGRRNILFIVALFAVLIIAILVIFPLLTGI